MVVVGDRLVWPSNGDLTLTEVGSGLIMAGIGKAMNLGAGRVITTAIGFMNQTSAGFGCPALNGLPPGFRGDTVAVIAAGRRSRLAAS